MQRRVLFAVALFCSAYLSTALTYLGINKFYYILAGGEKFGTFPNLSSQLGIGLSYLALFGLYGYWLLQKPFDRRSRFVYLLKTASPFLLLAFLAYPLGNDVYLYLHAGLMNLSQVNPFTTRADAFISGLSPFVDWGQTSTYGPISQVIFSLCAAVIPLSPILAIYSFKLICLGLHLLNGYKIWTLLPPDQRHKIAIAYLINPLLLLEQVSAAHVDVLVSTSLVLFAGCLLKRQYEGAFMALWGGFLSKTIPLIWMPLMALFLLRQRRWPTLLRTGLLSLGLIALLSFTALPGLAAWKSLLNPGVSGLYQSSLHAGLRSLLDALRLLAPNLLTLAEQRALLLGFTRLTLIVFAVGYSWFAWKTYRQQFLTPSRLIEHIGWVTLILMLVATPWLMPWYASVPLTIAALIPTAKRFGLTSLAFGFASSAQYLLQGQDGLKSLVAIGLPLLVWMASSTLITPSDSVPDSPFPAALPEGDVSSPVESLK